jgi:ribosomal protein S12 methylthiotransferase
LGWRKLYPGKKILLAGCLAQRYAKELTEALPEADGLFGINDLSAITMAASRAVKTPDSAFRAEASRSRLLPPGLRPLLSLPGSAYVKISEGCDNRCSFCAIPLIRGGLKSRSILDVVEECKTLLERGIKELCLIGQDSGSYGRDWEEREPALPQLMKGLSRLDGNFRVRLLYMHPDNFPLAILDIMEEDKRFLPYFDIPFQHGSDKILAAMNRRLNARDYLKLIETIRRKLEDAVIRSTFMTGFPGETGEDFALLLDFQEKAELTWLGCFAYSREENTQAYAMKGRVARKTAAERKRLVEERQIPITEKAMDSFVGRVFEVLVEEKFEPPASPGSEDPPGEDALYLGRLPCQAPEVDGAVVIISSHPLELGEMVPCRVVSRSGFDLEVRPEGKHSC